MTISDCQFNKIKTLRRNGFTQTEIAERIGISRKTVENYLRKLKANYEESMIVEIVLDESPEAYFNFKKRLLDELQNEFDFKSIRVIE